MVCVMLEMVDVLQTNFSSKLWNAYVLIMVVCCTVYLLLEIENDPKELTFFLKNCSAAQEICNNL